MVGPGLPKPTENAGRERALISTAAFIPASAPPPAASYIRTRAGEYHYYPDRRRRQRLDVLPWSSHIRSCDVMEASWNTNIHDAVHRGPLWSVKCRGIPSSTPLSDLSSGL